MINAKSNRAFTLIELLVVISIIGLLSSVVLASLNSAREKARVAQTVSQLRELIKAIAIYYDDTGQYPPVCGLFCNATNDPFINSLGVVGWRGPYFASIYNFKHQWGGHLEFGTGNIDGALKNYLFLDDDAPGTDYNDNSGIIPASSLVAIDKLLDDGNLNTGNVRGNDGSSAPWGTALGEIIILVEY